jgi:hypothetical protein
MSCRLSKRAFNRRGRRERREEQILDLLGGRAQRLKASLSYLESVRGGGARASILVLGSS